MPLNAQIMLSIIAHETAAGDFSRTLRATTGSYAATLTDGTGANQAQVVWSDSRTVPSNDTDPLDPLALIDDRGTVSMTSIKTIYVRNTGTVLLYFQFGEGIFTESLTPPGAVLFASRTDAAGWSPGGLSVLNTGNAVGSYDIVLIGEGTVT
jgi:hypothetical protein